MISTSLKVSGDSIKMILVIILDVLRQVENLTNVGFSWTEISLLRSDLVVDVRAKAIKNRSFKRLIQTVDEREWSEV